MRKHPAEVGDLYVTVVVPDYDDKSFRDQKENGWYLANENPELLEEGVLVNYYDLFLIDMRKQQCIVTPGREMHLFFRWLCGAKLGYVLITTGPGSYTVLPVQARKDVHHASSTD